MAEILFRADHIEGVLAGLPTIAAALPPSASEGTESTAFPGMRKTRREIYRLLSNSYFITEARMGYRSEPGALRDIAKQT